MTGGWRQLFNEELHNLYPSPNIIGIIRSRRLRWVWHIACLEEKRIVYKGSWRKRVCGRGPGSFASEQRQVVGSCEGSNELWWNEGNFVTSWTVTRFFKNYCCLETVHFVKFCNMNYISPVTLELWVEMCSYRNAFGYVVINWAGHTTCVWTRWAPSKLLKWVIQCRMWNQIWIIAMLPAILLCHRCMHIMQYEFINK